MGFLAATLGRFFEQKVALGATIPVGEANVPMFAQLPGQGEYHRYALEGYQRNDLVYAAIEERATSAAEPRLAVLRREAQGGAAKLPEHPLLALLEHPNPFQDRYSFIRAVEMYLCVAGNAYVHKERSAAGKVVQLWHLRPDRIRVLPDREQHIGGYWYQLGGEHWIIPPQDLIHFRTPALLDDYYGLPPLAVAAAWVNVANAVTSFTRAFFQNAGVPSGLLSIQRTVSDAERQLIRAQFRNEYGGPQGWHRTLVLDGGEASYTPMGLPLGERGLAMPSMDEILESHIVRPFGVPLELVGARLSMRGQRSAAREARAGFWDETMVPEIRMLASQLEMGLADEPVLGDGWDFLEFDLGTVQALQEDADALMTRAVLGFEKGVLMRSEARQLVGHAAGKDDDVFFMPRSSGLLGPDEVLVPGAPAATPLGPGVPGADAALGAEVPLAALPPGSARQNGTAKASEWTLELKVRPAGTGLIVCLGVPPRLAAALALPSGEPPAMLHCTLAFLHEAPPTRLIPRVRAVVQAVAAQQAPLQGTVSGVGRFSGAVPGDPDVIYASLDVPGLAAFRTHLVAALAAARIRTVPTHDFVPHVTLAYVPAHTPSPLARLDPMTVVFEALDVWAGSQQSRYPFQGAAELVGATNGAAPG